MVRNWSKFVNFKEQFVTNVWKVCHLIVWLIVFWLFSDCSLIALIAGLVGASLIFTSSSLPKTSSSSSTSSEGNDPINVQTLRRHWIESFANIKEKENFSRNSSQEIVEIKVSQLDSLSEWTGLIVFQTGYRKDFLIWSFLQVDWIQWI